MRYETTTAAIHAATRVTEHTQRAAYVLEEGNAFIVMGEATLFACLNGGLMSQAEFVERHHVTILPRVRRDWKAQS